MVKNLLASAGDKRDFGLISWSGASPGRMPTHSSILAWKVLWTGYSPWGHKQPDTTEDALTSSQYIMANKYMALVLFGY